jgi:hypothetical protein
MDKEARVAWHGSGADLEFLPSDFEVVDLVLGLIPELRVCAVALKRARAAGLKFPVTNPQGLFALFDGKIFTGAGHRFDTSDVSRCMPPEFFPIASEGELVSRIYIALIRCKHEEASQVHQAQKNQPKEGAL